MRSPISWIRRVVLQLWLSLSHDVPLLSFLMVFMTKLESPSTSTFLYPNLIAIRSPCPTVVNSTSLLLMIPHESTHMSHVFSRLSLNMPPNPATLGFLLRPPSKFNLMNPSPGNVKCIGELIFILLAFQALGRSFPWLS